MFLTFTRIVDVVEYLRLALVDDSNVGSLRAPSERTFTLSCFIENGSLCAMVLQVRIRERVNVKPLQLCLLMLIS